MKDKKLNSVGNVLKEILSQKVNTYKLLVVVLLLLNIIIFINLIFKNKTKKNTSNTIPVAISTLTPTNLPIPTAYIPIKSENPEIEYISISINGNHQKINIETKKIIANKDIIIDYSKFINLPKEYKNSNTSIKNHISLYSQDKLNVVIYSTKYDEAAEPEGYDGSQPVINVEYYICNIKTMLCNKNDIFPTGIIETLVWTNWDSKKNILYGCSFYHTTPVYVYSINQKTLEKTDEKLYPSYLETVPENFVSPTLSKMILIRKEDKKIYLYDTKNLLQPIKEIALTDNNLDSSTRESIIWFENENKISINTETGIYILDLEAGVLSQIISFTYKGDNPLINRIISPGGRYLVFVESIRPMSPDAITSKLKAIDLKNNYNVFDVFSTKDHLMIDTEFYYEK